MLHSSSLWHVAGCIGEFQRFPSQKCWRNIDAVARAYRYNFHKGGEQIVIKDRLCCTLRQVALNAIKLTPQF